MTKKKRIRLVHYPPWSWKKRIVLFLGIFGGFWLLLEPVIALGIGTGLLSSLGIWGYFGLVLVGAIPVFVQERLERNRFVGTLSFMPLEIILTKTGHRVPVEAPKDILVEEFLNLLLGTIASFAPRECSVFHLYNHNLLVKRGDHYVDVPIDKTLEEAGLADNDVCKIRGYIRIEFSVAYMSIGYRQEIRKIHEDRAKGKIFFDEDIAVDVSLALKKGIIDQERAEKINNWGRSSAIMYDQETFIVDNSESIKN